MVAFLKLILYAVDYLGAELSFTYKSYTKLKTVLGGIMSTIMMIFGIAIFYYFSIELKEKIKPETRLSQEEKELSEINLKEFPLVIAFVTPDGSPINDIYSYLTVIPTFFKIQAESGEIATTYTNGFFEKCDTDVHFGNHKDLFKDPKNFAPVGNEICLSPTKSIKLSNYNETSQYVDPKFGKNSEELSFYNEYAKIPSTFLNILLYKCDEQRDRKKCGSEENFKKLTQELYVVLYTLDYYIDLQDLTNPNKVKIRSLTQMVDYLQPIRNFIRYKKVSIQTDDGILFESTSNVINFFQFSNVKLDFFSSDFYFYSMTFEVEQVNDIFYRRYEKIQDVLAKVGGIFKIMSMVGHLIIYFYSKSNFYFEVTNILFEDENELCQKKMKPSKAYSELIRFNDQNLINVRSMIVNNKVKIETPKIHNIKKEALKLTFKDFLKSIVSKRSKYPSKLYDLSNQFITQKLNILTYFKKIRNVEQLIDILTINEMEKDIFNCKSKFKDFILQDENPLTEKENYDEIVFQMKERLVGIHS